MISVSVRVVGLTEKSVDTSEDLGLQLQSAAWSWKFPALCRGDPLERLPEVLTLHSVVKSMWTGLWRQAAVQSGAGCSRLRGSLHRGHPAKLAGATGLRGTLSIVLRANGKEGSPRWALQHHGFHFRLVVPELPNFLEVLARALQGRAWISQRAGAAHGSPPGHVELPTSTQLQLGRSLTIWRGAQPPTSGHYRTSPLLNWKLWTS